MRKLDMRKAEKRVKLYAATIDKEPPERLLCPEGAPSPELLAFCNETGASLDWIFCGDVFRMIRDSFAVATGAADAAQRPDTVPQQYREAHDDTDVLLMRMGGCVDGLVALVRDFDGLNCPDKEANTIVSLIHVVEEGLARLIDLHSAEWSALTKRGAAA